MEENRGLKAKLFGEMHAQARIKSGKSQEYVAMEMRVTRKTISNWERGINSPTFFQSIEYFEIIGINPLPYFMEYIYRDRVHKMNDMNDDELVDKEFDALVDALPTNIKKAIIFILCGKHGSSPISLVQLTLAHIHAPLKSRVVNATIIKHNYDMAEAQNELICQDDILPDTALLQNAIHEGKSAAIKNNFGYVSIKGSD